MRNANDWLEQDLLTLIRDRIGEDRYLDYKQSSKLVPMTDAVKKAISIDVSAFANAGGGVLVYGMREDKHVPTDLDDGLDPKVVTKEWLDQVIGSTIHRRIVGVAVNQVHLSGTRTGRVAYVVHVPQSTRAPHQAQDKRFYRRSNFESVPMEEYEIRDVARRLEAPDLEVTFVPQTTNLGTGTNLGLRIIISNHSPAPAHHALVQVELDKRLRIAGGGDFQFLADGVQAWSLGQARVAFLNRQVSSTNDGLPIFQGIRTVLTRNPILLEAPRSQEPLCLGWRVYAPYMQPRGEVWRLKHGESGFSLERDLRLTMVELVEEP